MTRIKRGTAERAHFQAECTFYDSRGSALFNTGFPVSEKGIKLIKEKFKSSGVKMDFTALICYHDNPHLRQTIVAPSEDTCVDDFMASLCFVSDYLASIKPEMEPVTDAYFTQLKGLDEAMPVDALIEDLYDEHDSQTMVRDLIRYFSKHHD